VLRTALRPRWLALLVIVLLAATAMARLGQWQLDRARQESRAAEQARQPGRPAPILDVLRARQTFTGAVADRLVVAEGRWDPQRQLLIPGRRLDGLTGLWVLTPLRLADGSAVAVVRGWVPEPGAAAAAPPPDAEVSVTGRLRPAEPAADRAPGDSAGLPAGQLERVAVVQLIQRWPYPLLTGYLVQTGQTPPATGPAPKLVPSEPSGGGLALRNVSYALQWWLFAGFGLFLWWRLVRDEHLGRPGPGRPANPGAGPAPPVGEDEAVPVAASPRDG